MDKRQIAERSRANGRGTFSPAIRRPLHRSFSKTDKAHAACAFSKITEIAKRTPRALSRFSRRAAETLSCFIPLSAPLRLCAIPLFAPLALLASDSESPRIITLDVAGGGVLGGVCTALVMWLNGQRKQLRTPPLGEDVARTYATKDELLHCRSSCRKDIDDIRAKIDDNDKKAEDRARGTHARIDALYRESQKMTKSLGMLIGIMVGKGIAPASTAITNESGE